MILGAVLAGGRSLRFGSDKALAVVDGRALIDHAIEALAGPCDAVVVVGRAGGVPDMPEPGLGPLGGLLGALNHAAARGFASVVTLPCDMPHPPADLLARLGHAPAHVADQPVVGHWPAAAAPLLRALIDAGERRVRALVDAVGSRAVELPGLRNVNRREDLAG